MDGRKVVVKTTISIETREDGKMFAGRLMELGLTSYGRTPNEASKAVKRQFHRIIDEYRKMGLLVLEKRLNEIGVEWCWLDEYTDADTPVEDTTPGAAAAKPPIQGIGESPMTQTMAMAA